MNSEGRVVPSYSARIFRSVEDGNLIEHLSAVLQSLKAVSKTFWYVKYPSIFRVELQSYPLSKSRRIGPQVDNDVVNSAPGAPHGSHFGMGRYLVMHAA